MSKAIENYKDEIQDVKKNKIRRFVYIDAHNIQLPLATGQNDPVDPHVYKFYVWAHKDSDGDVETAITNVYPNQLQVEVIGVPASIRPVSYNEVSQLEKFPLIPSRSVVEVAVVSTNIDKSFDIIAWFPNNFKKYEKDRSGEIDNMQTQLNSQKTDERKDFISSLKFKIEKRKSDVNPWGQRVTVQVYNGDLRAQVLMVGQDEVLHNFGPQFRKYFHVGRIFLRNQNPDKQLVVYTTSLRAKTLFYRSPNKEVAKALKDLDGKDSLSVVRNKLNITAGFHSETSFGLKTEDVMGIFDLSFKPPGNSNTNLDNLLAGKLSIEKNTPQYAEAIRIANYSRLISANAIRQADEAFISNLEKKTNYSIYTISDQILPIIRKQALEVETAGLDVDVAKTNIFLSVTNSIKKPDNSVLNENYQTQLKSEIAELFDVYQRHLRAEMHAGWELVKNEFLDGTPLDVDAPIPVNLDGKPLAFSDNYRRQAKLEGHGYVWQDYYRPMTFQSVLNSLIVSTENSGYAQTMRWLETAGIVAGGLVGMGTIFNEVTTRSYIEGVAVTTSVILPGVRNLLRDDLEKYIKNLSDLSMDTVTIIPPNGVADRYIFFPRGPIFGTGVSEFSMNEPSYIVEIDNDDVAVQAMLIEQGQSIQSGVVSAQQLVSGALDLGKSMRDQEQAKLIKMTENLRRFRLTTLESEVDELMKQTNTVGATQLIAGFKATFGEDPSGLVDRIAAKHNLKIAGGGGTITNTPPKFSLSPNNLTVKVGETNKFQLIIDDSDPGELFDLSYQSKNVGNFEISLTNKVSTLKNEITIRSIGTSPSTNIIEIIVKDKAQAAATNSFTFIVTD